MLRAISKENHSFKTLCRNVNEDCDFFFAHLFNHSNYDMTQKLILHVSTLFYNFLNKDCDVVVVLDSARYQSQKQQEKNYSSPDFRCSFYLASLTFDPPRIFLWHSFYR